MGLFGSGASVSRLGGATGAAARQVIEETAGGLEADMRDTPGEYLVLQAAGMLFASQTRTMEGAPPVGTMAAALARAEQILGAYADTPTTDPLALKLTATAVHARLEAAVAAGVEPAALVGQLNSYLHHVAGGYLHRTASPPPASYSAPVAPTLDALLGLGGRSRHDAAPRRTGLLVALLALPVLTGLIGLLIALTNPDAKSTVARLFFAALAIAGAGQAWFFGRRGVALLIAACGVALVLMVR